TNFISTPNATGERKVVLYSGDSGNHRYIGLGVQSATFNLQNYNNGAWTFTQGVSTSSSEVAMRLGKVSNNYLLRVGTDSTAPAVTLGTNDDTNGPTFGRASGNGHYITGSSSGDMCIRNLSGDILISTTSTKPQLMLATSGGDITAGV